MSDKKDAIDELYEIITNWKPATTEGIIVQGKAFDLLTSLYNDLANDYRTSSSPANPSSTPATTELAEDTKAQ